jgi:hypothetical protein
VSWVQVDGAAPAYDRSPSFKLVNRQIYAQSIERAQRSFDALAPDQPLQVPIFAPDERKELAIWADALRVDRVMGQPEKVVLPPRETAMQHVEGRVWMDRPVQEP